ncbi:MAG TPA: ABC transporter permease, partial [Roseiflexaceae bacterium]|nr:ABC transporter permease [Roseiflexaceae bacterium]
LGLSRSSPAVSGFLSDTLSPEIALQALIIAMVLGLVGGGYPALRAAGLAPVEAMRAESGAAVAWGPITRVLSRLLRGATLRNLLRRPTRSLMTIAGVGVGVGFIVAINGIAGGTEHLITEMLSAGQADIIAQQAGASDMMFSSVEERDIDLVRLHPEVRSVSRMVLGSTNVPGLPFFIIYGLDPREEYLPRYRVYEGRTIQRPGEILLGRLAANSLEKNVGDTLRLSGASFTIVGISETGIGYEDSGGVIALRDAQRLFGKPRQVSFLSITVSDPGRAEAVAADLERRIPALLASPTNDLTSRIQDFATMDAIFGALIVLMLVVGGVVMMNVMLMSVFERTHEIGVLRAIGWSSGRVLRMIMAESVVLSILSAGAGVLIGIGLTWLLSLAPYYGDVLQPIYTTDVFVQVFFMAIGLGLIGGLLPAWRAVQLQPVEALHYE